MRVTYSAVVGPEKTQSLNKVGDENMKLRVGAVAVTQLPETLTSKQSRIFFRDLERSMHIERPCVVLDCSKVRVMDRSAIHLMLCCLEEAMKRNGDVKLSSVSPEAREMLKLTRADRLFKTYDTNADATNSFYHRSTHTHSAHKPSSARKDTNQSSEIAA